MLQVSESEFDTHVRARREAAGVENDSPSTWALALSGGGIRSATFCLGLVRGLAERKLLKKFDYLSTVSGGGYLGASLGRLYNATTSAAQVEERVASQDSMWLWWLRNNGRYLTPAGGKDLGFAAASVIRGVISTHIEIGILILMLSAVVLLPHLLVALFPPFLDATAWNHRALSLLPSVWAWLMVIPAWACIYQICAYWYTRDKHTGASLGLIVAAPLTCVATMTWLILQHPDPLRSLGASLLLLALTAPIMAAGGALVDYLRGIPASTQRLLRTKKLSYGLWGLVAFAALVVLDRGAWEFTKLIWAERLEQMVYRIGGGAMVLAAIGRFVLPELQRRLATAKGSSLNTQRLVNVIGVALSAVVALLWTGLLSAAMFPRQHRETYWDMQQHSLLTVHPLLTLTVVFCACLAYVWLSRRSFDLLNLASLHNYYRARIERAYVSSGNDKGAETRFPDGTLSPVTPGATSRVGPLTEAIDGDDIDLENYAPHKWGGPIHLINCCINQSVDDRTGVYNADRKGVAMTISPLGVEVGTRPPAAVVTSGLAGRLSKWIAISGAAAGSGMGSYTSPGLAALLFMSGIRLGYWTQNLLGSTTTRESSTFRDRLLDWFPKPLAIVAESMARFPGLSSPVWYVSDGGHFDNTGIYALLKRRPSVIVAADCGADPKYLFGDLESLVRKAKIDYGASIDFIPVTAKGMEAELAAVLGTPETIDPVLGDHWLVLGRITYATGEVGTLIVVKPRRLDAMPFDLVAYADRNPEFPQQGTGDQFFDEAQWEAYHQLGVLMGRQISPKLIEQAVLAVHAVYSDKPCIASSLASAEATARKNDAKTRRGERAGLAVRATLGAGVSLSLMIAAWQGFEQYRESRREEQRLYEAQVFDLNDRVQNGPIEKLLKEHFNSFARQSGARGDGAMVDLQKRLNTRCESLTDTEASSRCALLYAAVSSLYITPPEPFYDYWFLDKRAAFEQSQSRPNPPQAMVSAGSPVPHDVAASTPMEDVAFTPALGQTAETVVVDRSPASAEPFVPEGVTCAPGVRVHLHVYDEDSRPAAIIDGERLKRVLGAEDAHVENVVATAIRRGTAAPYIWTRPTLIYPAASDPACISAVSNTFSGIKLKKINSGNANHLEFWLPPRTEAAMTTE